MQKKFHIGLTGYQNFGNRLLASYKQSDESISPHQYTEVLRQSIPKAAATSLRGIESYIYPGKPKDFVTVMKSS